MSGRVLFVAWAVMVAPLLLASLAVLILRRGVGRERAADVLARGLPGWWGLGLLLGLALWAGTAAVVLMFALLSFLALREFITLAPTRPGDHTALAASFYLILPLHYLLLALGWFGLLPLFIPLYAFLVLPMLAALSGDIRRLQARAAEIHWGLMLAVYCLSHVPALMLLPGGEGRGGLLMLFLLATVYVADMAQLVGNELFGRHPLARISHSVPAADADSLAVAGRTRNRRLDMVRTMPAPSIPPCVPPQRPLDAFATAGCEKCGLVPRFSDGRTWEGLLAGALAAAVLGAGLHRLTPYALAEAVALALAVSLLGALGGLVMAAIKRDHGDWRRGGMLDRIAPLCFSAPVYFHLVRQAGA